MDRRLVFPMLPITKPNPVGYLFVDPLPGVCFPLLVLEGIYHWKYVHYFQDYVFGFPLALKGTDFTTGNMYSLLGAKTPMEVLQLTQSTGSDLVGKTSPVFVTPKGS